MPDVRRLPADLRDRALDTVLAAFATDPLLRWVWPDDERYDACGRGFFGLLLDLRLAAGEVWTADGGSAVAMWDPPGGLYLPTPDAVWTGVKTGFTEVERGRWATYESVMRLPQGMPPHWYLGVLATEPARQRGGLARAVVAPVLAAADRTGLATYLETASEDNLAVYGRLGFETVRDAPMPDAGPTCWLMRRDPREAAAQ